MKREIKFRAWDKVENKMISWKTLCNQVSNLLNTINGGSNWEYLQDTGIKDKNGVEIFDGYIVKDRFGSIGQVIIGNYQHKDCYHKGVHILFKDGEISPFPAILHNEEVIGNIYENPNLLDSSNIK